MCTREGLPSDRLRHAPADAQAAFSVPLSGSPRAPSDGSARGHDLPSAPKCFLGLNIGTDADSALETRCSKLSNVDASASHHVQPHRPRTGTGQQCSAVLMYNSPGFVRTTKSQVRSAQGTRSLEGAVAGLRARLHASIQDIPRDVWESMLTGDPESYDFY